MNKQKQDVVHSDKTRRFKEAKILVENLSPSPMKKRGIIKLLPIFSL